MKKEERDYDNGLQINGEQKYVTKPAPIPQIISCGGNGNRYSVYAFIFATI
ncbi:hypothetical protein [uncultured Proteiniphilum sp.]|uniref:hypothetical protein n=1 Tax=uncultured Proteiniphilum sp. TaxID=497637 RepID=UPI002601D26F|nr:hypothetical protein [uncultured Proteiniphilum sp.]